MYVSCPGVDLDCSELPWSLQACKASLIGEGHIEQFGLVDIPVKAKLSSDEIGLQAAHVVLGALVDVIRVGRYQEVTVVLECLFFSGKQELFLLSQVENKPCRQANDVPFYSHPAGQLIVQGHRLAYQLSALCLHHYHPFTLHSLHRYNTLSLLPRWLQLVQLVSLLFIILFF